MCSRSRQKIALSLHFGVKTLITVNCFDFVSDGGTETKEREKGGLWKEKGRRYGGRHAREDARHGAMGGKLPGSGHKLLEALTRVNLEGGVPFPVGRLAWKPTLSMPGHAKRIPMAVPLERRGGDALTSCT